METRNFNPVIEKMRQYLENHADIAAAYLFGSAALWTGAVNDLDLMILEYRKKDRLKIQVDLADEFSELSGFPPDKIDIVFFDRDEVDPDVLKSAVNLGILLKNNDPALLADKIEDLSEYFLRNEVLRKNADRLRKERLEAFCGSR